VFFCDETSVEWQRALYDRIHGQLKRMHETLGVPYFYVEWRQALQAVASADGAVPVRAIACSFQVVSSRSR
jgi:hypothetical protein